MSLVKLDYAIAVATILVIGFVYLRNHKTHYTVSHFPLPPGPPIWPLIGSFFHLPDPAEPAWVWFTQWANNTASDIIHFRVFGADTIVLNTRAAAIELLEHRSNKYSDRPHMVMASELVGWKRMLAMADYHDGAKNMRRYIHHSISARTAPEWRPQQEQEAHRLLQKLLHSPENLISHIRQTSGATVARLTYGYTPKDEDDDYIKIAERAMDNFALATTPGAFLVDVIPLLKYIPWAPFQRTAAKWRGQLTELINVPMALVYDQMKRGVAEPSFVSEWLEEPSLGKDKSLIPVTAAALYAGGADTTVSAISTFFLAMVHYPEVQRLAQKEIDEAIGTDRLPTLADRGTLPYVEALCKEIWRWKPMGPVGIPHRLGSGVDDMYKGMRIPANSMVIANIWNMLQDQGIHPNPEAFEPSRYLGPNPEPNPEEVAFGFGRRRCPGVNIARSSVWLSVALTLATYNITPLTGEDRKPALPSLEYANTTIRHPKPFRCGIAPRSEKMRKIIKDISL